MRMVKASFAAVLVVASAPLAAQNGRALAHPRVTGSAGPYARATVVLTRPAGGDALYARFNGVVEAGGRQIALGSPDEPEDFFIFDVKAVVFTPIDRSPTNGIVILYDSSKIGPMNGTDERVLVYRVEAGRAVRQRAIEDRLEGTRNAAELRARLARMRR